MLSKKRKINTKLFKEVFSQGDFLQTDFFSIKTLKLPNNQLSKFTLVVPKKIIKTATQRNFLRRRFFNIIKKLPIQDFSISTANIFILKKDISHLSFDELNNLIIKLLKKIK